MPTYLVTYDLRKQRNYAAIHEAIKTYGTYAQVLESVWVIVTHQNATQINEYLYKHMDADDGLLVLKLAKEGACEGISQPVIEWLNRNL